MLEAGGNAVIGYRQYFDLEGSCMVARGIGTLVTLSKLVHKERERLNSSMMVSGVQWHLYQSG